MDINRLLVYILGLLAALLIVAIAVLTITGHDSPLALTASLSAALGAILALAHLPRKD